MEPARLTLTRAALRAHDGPRAVDMTGLAVGHWRVVRQVWSRHARAQWLCRCACSAERVISGTDLRAMPRRGIQPCRACGRGSPEAPGEGRSDV